MWLLFIALLPGVSLSDFVHRLDSALVSLHSSSKRLLCVIGDFNAKSSTRWSGQSSNDAGTALFSLMLSHGQVQLVDGSTHCVGERDASIPT